MGHVASCAQQAGRTPGAPPLPKHDSTVLNPLQKRSPLPEPLRGVAPLPAPPARGVRRATAEPGAAAGAPACASRERGVSTAALRAAAGRWARMPATPSSSEEAQGLPTLPPVAMRASCALRASTSAAIARLRSFSSARARSFSASARWAAASGRKIAAGGGAVSCCTAMHVWTSMHTTAQAAARQCRKWRRQLRPLHVHASIAGASLLKSLGSRQPGHLLSRAQTGLHAPWPPRPPPTRHSSWRLPA